MQSLCFSSDPGTQRHSTYTATETDSNPSYENPVVVESDNDDPGYIIVLPEGATPVTNQSRASTPSSDVLHDYENVPEKKGDGADSRGEYLNVENFHNLTSQTERLRLRPNVSDSDRTSQPERLRLRPNVSDSDRTSQAQTERLRPNVSA
ncbi:hypothetical protein GBF38_021055 [Nibea albiflora]|uniref:Uncharacterized protein n=1 Tax=Nibea albiflora TaxID=240163 RepID=A0ACB7EWI3_NIBAL|nr:hypothetical protein GBF38_021055 [Nibea albiflora]